MTVKLSLEIRKENPNIVYLQGKIPIDIGIDVMYNVLYLNR